jgi:hypothetical protein
MLKARSDVTLRETLENVIGIDDDPLGCAFAIAALLRSAVQGEPSTFEGECASLVKASEHYDLTNGDGIRKWLGDLGWLPDIDVPDPFWLSIVEADQDEEGD